MIFLPQIIPLLCVLFSCIGHVFSSEIYYENFHEENTNFCIQTQSILLASDLAGHGRTTADCKIIARTLTAEEADHFVKIMCQETHKFDPYYFLKLRNGELTGRGVHTDICPGQLKPYFAWLPFETLQSNFLTELNPIENLNYIGKARSGQSNLEFCHFPNADLVANSTSKHFKCHGLEQSDISFPLDDQIDVLVEIQPLYCEVRNLTYLPWFNTSTSYKTVLGHSKLQNNRAQIKQIFGALSYAFMEKVHLNVSSVYGGELDKLPIVLQHNDVNLKLDAQGNGSLEIKDKAYFGRVMSPFSEIKVNVIGQWSALSKEFSAHVYEYFGQGIERFRAQIHHGLVTFVRITSTEPAFEMNESKDTQMANKYAYQRKYNGHVSSTVEEVPVEDIIDHVQELDLTSNGHPYPNFYIYTIIASLIVGTAFLLAIGYMVHTCSKERGAKQQKNYKLTSTVIH